MGNYALMPEGFDREDVLRRAGKDPTPWYQKGQPEFQGFDVDAWNKLMDPKIGGQNRLNLYVEAITKMTQNPHLPQLFRDVFKGAFLPYRDSETLNLFLKEINGFIYDHSENLGDAFGDYVEAFKKITKSTGGLNKGFKQFELVEKDKPARK